jgi:uncharacterized membrane protein (DUF4010 family)
MEARTVRRVAIAVVVIGIAGMIVTSIADNTGGATTFGIITAIAGLCLLVATAVSAPPSLADPEIGALVAELVAAGADEEKVWALAEKCRGRVHGGRTQAPAT